MSKKLILAALALALAGQALAAGETAAKAPAKSPAKKQSTVPIADEDLLARTVFQSLVGELALQRGDTELGVSAWADLARRTRDPDVIARAAEVAAATRQYELALELTALWLQVEPESTKARQTESTLLLLANRLDDLAPQLASLLEQDKANIAGSLMHLNRMLGRHSDKKAVQRLIDRVATPYGNLPEAHFAMGLAAANADDLMHAQGEFQKALQLRPDWESAELAYAQLLARTSPASAIESLNEFLARKPDARDARLTLANARSALGHGARVITYASAVRMIEEDGRAVGAVVRGTLPGESEEAQVRARVVVNAAGPWVDEVRRLENREAERKLQLTKGIHLVVPRTRLPIRHTIIMNTPDRRSIFAVPREKAVYIGTTDTFSETPEYWPEIMRGDVDYLLDTVNRSFGVEPITDEDILAAWSGLRPAR